MADANAQGRQGLAGVPGAGGGVGQTEDPRPDGRGSST